MTYQEVLDEIFRTYMSAKSRIKGLRYQDYKNTQILKDLIGELDLAPEPAKVIKVTGSKGKGTTARSLARTLSSHGLSKVALFTSPEEIEHTDRIAINLVPISERDFVRHFMLLKPALEKAEKSFQGEFDYFSPYGLFLLIALSYYKEEGVDALVIECGRGVRYDDSNALESRLGVVTSIFKEHLDYFGPELEDVFRDKIAIAETSEIVLMPSSLKSFKAPDNSVFLTLEDEAIEGIPHVYGHSFQLATKAASLFLGREVERQKDNFFSSSYGLLKDRYPYDSLIDVSGIDEDWVRSYQDAHFFISLPDDKDFDQFIARVRSLGLEFTLIALRGTRGYLDYEKTKASGEKYVECELSVPESEDFYQGLSDRDTLVFWGTQSFIRFVKKGLN